VSDDPGMGRRQAITRRGLLKALRVVLLIFFALALAYVGLAYTGVIRSPFFPRADGDLALARSQERGLRVLFVGNSFTFANSMPAMVHRLGAADPGADPVFSVEYVAPGWTLEEAADNSGLAKLIAEVNWDDVVLQERSWYLAISEADWDRTTTPYVWELRNEIEATGAEAHLFMTWGYQHGVSDADTYVWMQERLDSGYTELGDETFADVVPVGRAWSEALARRPSLDLWGRDGRHPNKMGSYLAACVFYAELTGRDPADSSYIAGLDESEASFLQDVATDVAMADSS
jgi:hypothetical protein